MSPDLRRVCVCVAGMCTFLNLYAPQAVLPALATSFGVAQARTGLTITAPLLAIASMAPFVGAISDRLGRKNLIVGACAILTLPTLLVALAPDLDILLLGRFLQGLLLPFIFTVTVAYIGDELDGAEAIRAAGWYSVGAILGGYGGRLVAGLAASLGSWRFAFFAIAGLVVAGAVFLAAKLPRERRFRPTTGGVHGALRAYRDHLGNPTLWAICVVGFGMLFSNVAVYTFVNFHLAAAPFNLAPSQLGLVFTVYLLGIVTTSAATRLAVRIGRRATLLLSVLLSAVGLLVTLVASVPVIIAGLAAFSGGAFVMQALCMGYIGIAAPRAKSSAVGLYVTLYYIGGALGGLLPGWAWHHGGWPGVVVLIEAVFAVLMVVGWRGWRAAS